MRRTFRALLAAAAVVLILASAAAGQPGWEKYTHPKYGFSISCPADWPAEAGEEKMFGTLVVFLALGPLSASPEPFRMNVNVTTEKVPADFTVQRYYALSEAQMELAFRAYRRLRTDTTTVGKEPAILRYSTWQRTDGFEMYQMALLVVSKRRGYVVTGTTASQSRQLQAEAALLAGILQTFRTK